MLAAAEAGADIIEVGVPWSDPSADGKAIQAAIHRALASGGGMTKALALTPRRPQGAPEPGHRAVRLREPDHRHGAGGVRGRGARGRRRRRAVRRLSGRRGRRADDGAAARQLDFVPLLAPTSTPARIDVAAARRERLHLLRVADRHHRHAPVRHGGAAREGGGDQGAHGRQAAGRRRLRHQDAGRRARASPASPTASSSAAPPSRSWRRRSPPGRDPVPDLAAFVRSLRDALDGR